MTVYLIGAGPGDPGLLTVRAAELLARADLVVHDRLVDAAVLSLASPAARMIDVGKRPGASETTQSEINALLIESGREECVVRLKGGDPYVFGRGGEEARALAEAGVDYTVVPGVSAALAVPALAGVPLSLRGVSSAIVIVTGHDPENALSYADLARKGATLVVLMAGATHARLAKGLVEAGLDASTPVVATSFGTLPTQHSEHTTLGGLGSVNLASPVTIVIGAVASERLFSFEDRPLAFRRVVVTRRLEQSGSLERLLQEGGAEVVGFPTIALAPPEDGGAALAEAVARIGDFEWVVLSSQNGVGALFGHLRDARDLHGVGVAAIGRETERALRERGVIADLAPLRGGSEGLLALFPPARGSARALLVRAEQGRVDLEIGLSGLGYEVRPVAAYKTVLPDSVPPLASLGGADAIVFASPSAVSGFLALAGRARLPGVVVSIGATTSASLRAEGIEPSAEAAEPSAAGLFEALLEAIPLGAPKGPDPRPRIAP